MGVLIFQGSFLRVTLWLPVASFAYLFISRCLGRPDLPLSLPPTHSFEDQTLLGSDIYTDLGHIPAQSKLHPHTHKDGESPTFFIHRGVCPPCALLCLLSRHQTESGDQATAFEELYPCQPPRSSHLSGSPVSLLPI